MSPAPALLHHDTLRPGDPVLVHSFVSGTGTTTRPARAVLSDVATSVLQTCAWAEHPVTVAELAARQQISPAVIAVAVSDLLNQGLLHLHSSHPDACSRHTHLRRVAHRLSGRTPPFQLVKILVVGAQGSGVSTFVGQMADSAPLVYADPPQANGRVQIDTAVSRVEPGLYLGLFGASGLDEYSPQWTDLTRHAVGAVVLAHSNRIVEAAPMVRALRTAQVPFTVGVNLIADADPTPDQVRSLLGVDKRTPVVMSDARLRDAVARTLTDLCVHVDTLTAHPHVQPSTPTSGVPSCPSAPDVSAEPARSS